MGVAIFALSVVLALAASLATRRIRTVKLRRLAKIVRTGLGETHTADTGGIAEIERFFPAPTLRHMRLLDIHPTPRGSAAIAAVLATAITVAGVFAGALFAATVTVFICLAGAAAIHILAQRRINELGALMPEFFDRVRQLLVIGNSLPTAFSRALLAGQPRLAAFFGPAVRRVANGAGFADAIRQSADDVSLYEMDMFSAAVSTNMRFGGSLTRSLSNLVQFLRKRASIERELRANTAMIRSSAWVLALLPVLVATLIISQNREYAHWFVVDPTGKFLLGYCVCSQIVGAFVMRAITRTEF